MSRRVSFSSSIKDRDLAISALDALKYSYRAEGENVLSLTSGPLSRATIDLRTGDVVSDSDYHSRSDLGGLRQAYSEAEVRRVIQRQGSTIESRRVTDNGDVKLLVRMVG